MARSPLVRLPKPMIKGFSSAHRALVSLTGGRLGGKFRGQPLILLTTTGRKSGKDRTWPLVGLSIEADAAPDAAHAAGAAGSAPKSGWVVAASNGGHDAQPAWYLNLQAHPEATVHAGSDEVRVRARDASPAERARHWPRFVETLGTYAEYQEATDREIPVVLLEPVT
ncbi:MAG: nitroreductase/quinone reductase family protein [Acidimicrobiia bacterium]